MYEIKRILIDWKKESKTKGVLQYKYSFLTGVLIIYTSYPGWLIGRAGWIANKYGDILITQIKGLKEIEIVEVDKNCIY